MKKWLRNCPILLGEEPWRCCEKFTRKLLRSDRLSPGPQSNSRAVRGKHSIRESVRSLIVRVMKQIRRRERPLNTPDLLHVRAAECWLALGDLDEANREVENIRPRSRRHSEVRKLCDQIRASTRYVQSIISDYRIL